MYDDGYFFPKQPGKSYHRTCGYKEVALFEGSCERSYRKTSASYIYRVKQELDFSPSCIRSESLQEAKEINECIEKKAEEIIEQFGAKENDNLKEKRKSIVEDGKLVRKKFKELKGEAPEDIAAKLELNESNYEKKTETINVSIDDVGSKRQVSERKNRQPEDEQPSRKDGKKAYSKRKFYYQTVIKFAYLGKSYAIVGKLNTMYYIILAFLLNNNTLNKNWTFHVDGQKTLHSWIESHFKGLKIKLILDWYHLHKKMKMQFYMGVQIGEKRDEIHQKVMRYAWYGLVEEAILVLNKIPSDVIKDKKRIDNLIEYFERNKAIIPNYELRKRLGLKISSNEGEKMNDLLISSRQKNNGMSWTKKGANALAVLSTLKQNKEKKRWLDKGTLSFKFAA